MKETKALAKAILDAAKAREESFDHAAAAQAQAEGRMVDLASLYDLTIREATEIEGANPFLAFPAYLLLSNCWNDSLSWAELNV